MEKTKNMSVRALTAQDVKDGRTIYLEVSASGRISTRGIGGKMEYRITAQVLDGATGEVREVIARVKSTNEQDAVNALFNRGRRDDYYYRFLGVHGVLIPTCEATAVKYNGMEYWARA